MRTDAARIIPAADDQNMMALRLIEGHDLLPMLPRSHWLALQA